MIEVVKRKADYAENQSKFLLKDLNNQNHGVRLKGIKSYQEYIECYRPDMYDDDVDRLFLGDPDTGHAGLLYWSGSHSTKHDGQLKRIAANVISLIRFLISLEPDEFGNLFFERFMRLPLHSLREINFAKHITPEGTTGLMSSTSRLGNSTDACEILSLIVQYHVDENGDPNPVDLLYLCGGSVACKELFLQWFQETAREEMIRNIAARSAPKVLRRATQWDEVVLRPVPLQADEQEGEVEDKDDDDDGAYTVPDPLGKSMVDLQATQAMHMSGMHRIGSADGPSRADRRISSLDPVMKLTLVQRMQESMKNVAGKISSDSQNLTTATEEMNLDDEDDDDLALDERMISNQRRRHTNIELAESTKSGSVLPSEKNFLPELFLSLVHGSTSKQDLASGLQNLDEILNQQSTRRGGLVRQHYGLFVHCVDGLEWLKAYHESTAASIALLDSPTQSVKSAIGGTKVVTSGVSLRKKSLNGILQTKKVPPLPGQKKDVEIYIRENRMLQAKHFLALAKEEAQNTLAPILSRMSRSRQVKNADQILRRLVSTLEYPYAMQQTLSAGDYEGVLNIYRRVQSLPATSGLRILKRVSNRADSIVADMKQKIVSTLLSPTPVFSVLPRLVKLIQELEDQDGCRQILQQCFDKQMQTFEENVRSVGLKFSESLLRAYMKGQEINMMNKDSSQVEEHSAGSVSAAHSRSPAGSRPSMTHMGESGKRIAAVSALNTSSREKRRSQIMEALSVYDSDSASVISDNSGSDLLLDDFDDGDMDDTGAETRSVSSSDTSNSAGNRSIRKGTQVDDDWLTDPGVDYSEILCAKVRSRTCRGLIEILDMWLPSVNRVLQILSSAYPVAAGGLKSGAVSSALLAANSVTPRKNAPSSHASTSNMSRALNTTYGRNQSIAAPAKQLGECLISCADMIRTITLGFKCKTTAPIMFEITNKGIFSQDMIQNALKEPFLTNTIIEVSEVYDVIETMLTRRNRQRPDGGPTVDDFDNINFFGSSVYRDSIVTLRAVAEDGEGAIVKNALENLMTGCLQLLSTVTQSPSIAAIPQLGDHAPKGSAAGKRRSGEAKGHSIDDMIITFENAVVKCLNRLANIVRRPEWVAQSVWDIIQRLLDRFIASLAVNASDATSSSSLPTQKRQSQGAGMVATGSVKFALAMEAEDEGDYAGQRAPANVSADIAGAALELETLEISLTDTHHVQAVKDRSLDFIKACVHLRTRTVSRLWNEVKNLFPLDHAPGRPLTLEGGVIPGKEGRTIDPLNDISMLRRKSRSGLGVFTYDDEDGNALTPTRRRSGTQADGAASTSATNPITRAPKEKGVEDRISLSVGSIAVMEENAVVKYLDMMLLYFRTNVHASYSIIVKAEMTSTWEKIQCMASGGVPSHISKILLELEFIQAELLSKLTGMTIAARLGQGSDSKLFPDKAERRWLTDATKYEEFLFHIICISVLDVYADLVESLAINAFSIHSTGRKPVSRRVSCSSRSLTSSETEQKGVPDRSIDYSVYTCKYLLSCGQALEEFEFLQMAVNPIVLSITEIPIIRCKDHVVSQLRAKKKDALFKSRSSQLWQEARLFVEAVRNKSSGRYAVRHK